MAGGGTLYGSPYYISLSYSALRDCITCARSLFLHFRVSISRQTFTNLCHVLDIFSSLSSSSPSSRRVNACVLVCVGVCVRVLTLLTIASSAVCLRGLALSSLHTLHEMINALYLTVCFYTCINMFL